MASIFRRLPLYFDQLLRELGYFFCRFRVGLWGEDAYSGLLLALQSRETLPGTLFGTLNYDRVFEYAASVAGLRVHYGRHAPVFEDVWLYKLHGSCTFVPPIYDFQGVPMAVDSSEVPEYIEGRLSNARQVMSLYTQSKAMIGETAVWLKHMHQDWIRAALHCESLCVVGAAPPAEGGRDEHVWEPIVGTEALVSYVGRRSDFDRLQALRGDRGCEHLGSDFGESVDAIADQVASV